MPKEKCELTKEEEINNLYAAKCRAFEEDLSPKQQNMFYELEKILEDYYTEVNKNKLLKAYGQGYEDGIRRGLTNKECKDMQ